jgi:hypothetical protein
VSRPATAQPDVWVILDAEQPVGCSASKEYLGPGAVRYIPAPEWRTGAPRVPGLYPTRVPFHGTWLYSVVYWSVFEPVVPGAEWLSVSLDPPC